MDKHELTPLAEVPTAMMIMMTMFVTIIIIIIINFIFVFVDVSGSSHVHRSQRQFGYPSNISGDKKGMCKCNN